MTVNDSQLQKSEIHRQIGVATATYYPSWYVGSSKSKTTSVDKLRGDLALETIREAKTKGYQLVVVDGGSSPIFRETVSNMRVRVDTQKEPSMSASRRQALGEVAALKGIKVVCWTEPEKISMPRDCILAAALPILEGNADVVIPHRGAASFATYPKYQADYEIESNQLWNNILRQHQLLTQGNPDLDAWIGPRLFKNDAKILKLFKQKYKFTDNNQVGLDQFAPELWANVLFLPIIAALKVGYKVTGVDVPYRHPATQTAFEQNNLEFERKRAFQQRCIIETTKQFVRLLEGDLESEIELF